MTQQEFITRYKYSIRTDRLGGGAFGTVYKAYDTVYDRYVAIKVAEVKTIGNRVFSLKDELDAVKDLPPHRNIANYEPRIYQFEQTNGLFDYAIMQYYPEGNLKQLLDNHQLSIEEKQTILKSILEGIAHLHDYKIIHRDLKPSNILVATYKGQYIPKIADFGLSKKADEEASQFTNSFAGGSLPYSAPEQLLGQPLRLNADLWALGIIGYEMLLGERPFRPEKSSSASISREREIYDKIVNAPLPNRINAISEPYQQMIRECLVKDAKKRVDKAGRLLKVLDNKQQKASNSTKTENKKENKQEQDITRIFTRSEASKLADTKTIDIDAKNSLRIKIFAGITTGAFFFLMMLALLFEGAFSTKSETNVSTRNRQTTTNQPRPSVAAPEVNSLKNSLESGTFTDTRDGQTYPWIRLKDGKKWMAKNLNYSIPDSWCYDNKESNCDEYGRLYTWDAAKIACPKGWHLPSDGEWWEMSSQYGKAYNMRDGQEKNSTDNAGKETYKALMTGGSSGFSAILGGDCGYYGSFYYVGYYGDYWSSTEEDSSNAWGYSFRRSFSYLYRNYDNKSWGYSCRCIQN